MIKEIIIDNHVLKYQITYKNNKNTYFRFNRNGYIQINASKYQNPKEIIKYIKKNSKSFIEKYNKIKISNVDKSDYYYFGEKYNKVKDKSTEILMLSKEKHVISEPDIPLDQLKILYKALEKKVLLKKLADLKQKYISNSFMNIENISFKTRYMQTRFGSCNPIKKTININLHLVNYDESYLEYVFLHEIAHLVHRNHSIDYYQLLGKLSKNYKQLKKELNNQFKYRW